MNNQPKLQIEYVDSSLLTPNPWNPNVVDSSNQLKLETSIERLGVFKPVIVRLKDDALEILGGQHRWQYLHERGEQVPILNLGEISDEKAKEVGLVDNGRYGEDDPLAMRELIEEMDASIAEITSFMPTSDEELASLFKDAEVDFDAVTGEKDFDTEFENEGDDNMSKILIKVPYSASRSLLNILEEKAFEIDAIDEDKAVRFGKALLATLDIKGK